MAGGEKSAYRKITVKDGAGREIHDLVEVNGLIVPKLMRSLDEVVEVVQNVQNLPIRDDDIMFCSPVKSGTHWVFEIISMLLNGKAETIPHSKGKLMLEAVPKSELEKCPSPRVLNSHLPLTMLPKDIKGKKTKVILVLRNPKDTCVSLFNHHKGIRGYRYDGDFKDYLPLFLNGQVDYGDWFEYVLKMEAELNKSDYVMHLVYYEDLKEKGKEEIMQMAEFLGVSVSEDLCDAINDKCDFNNMVKDKEYDPAEAEELFRGGFSMYRKGQIGDWKNYFTVAMSEEFDCIYNKIMKNSKLKFMFSPSNRNPYLTFQIGTPI